MAPRKNVVVIVEGEKIALSLALAFIPHRSALYVTAVRKQISNDRIESAEGGSAFLAGAGFGVNGKKREGEKKGIGGGWLALSTLLLLSLLSLFPFSNKKKKQAVKLKTKKRPKKLTPSDKKHVGATYPALPPPPPAYTILKAGASN